MSDALQMSVRMSELVEDLLSLGQNRGYSEGELADVLGLRAQDLRAVGGGQRRWSDGEVGKISQRVGLSLTFFELDDETLDRMHQRMSVLAEQPQGLRRCRWVGFLMPYLSPYHSFLLRLRAAVARIDRVSVATGGEDGGHDDLRQALCNAMDVVKLLPALQLAQYAQDELERLSVDGDEISLTHSHLLRIFDTGLRELMSVVESGASGAIMFSHAAKFDELTGAHRSPALISSLS